MTVHTDTVKFSFLVDHLFSLAEARDATTAASAPSEEVKEQESGDGEDDIEGLWEVSNLRHSSERSPSVLERVKSLCESFSLSLPTTVVKPQQQIDNAIWAFADYPRLEASVKTKDAKYAADQENWEQKAAVYEKDLAEFRRQVNNKCADLPKSKELNSTVKNLEFKLASSQSSVQKLKEHLLAALKSWRRVPACRQMLNRLLSTCE